MALNLISLLLTHVSANFFWGSCPETPVVQNFDLEQYLGTWYEIIRTEDFPYEIGECNKAEYTSGSDGYITVVNSEQTWNGKDTTQGWAYCSSDGTGQCYVKFSYFSLYGSYRVLETDYQNYAVVFSCSSYGLFHYEYGWYLARDPSFNADLDSNLLTQVTNLQSDMLIYTDQFGCN